MTHIDGADMPPGLHWLHYGEPWVLRCFTGYTLGAFWGATGALYTSPISRSPAPEAACIGNILFVWEASGKFCMNVFSDVTRK